MGQQQQPDSSASGCLFVVVLVVLFAVGSKALWFGAAGIVLVWLFYKGLTTANRSATEDSLAPQPSPSSTTTSLASKTSALHETSSSTGVSAVIPPQPTRDMSSSRFQANLSDPVRTPTFATPSTSSEFRIPTVPKQFGPGRWIRPGETVEVAGTKISGGMIYVGTSLKTPYGSNSPCLIDPTLPVGSWRASGQSLSYWPSYAEITPSARRGYLNWLTGGRTDPAVDIGFVFLFFYGLEQRTLVDARFNDSTKQDWPMIAAELRRLIGIYGNKSGSFLSYANGLLNWVTIGREGALNEKVDSDPGKSGDLPMQLKLALGQAAMAGEPIPAPLARSWLKHDPNYFLRTPATRCPTEFDAAFDVRYHERFGIGLVIPPNRTKLKFTYHPASSGLRGYGDFVATFGDVPDVTILTKPIQSLREIAEAATDKLDSFSRLVGRNPELRNALEGALLLPQFLWPAAMRASLCELQERTAKAPVTMSLGELQAQLGAKTDLNKERSQSLALALAQAKVGIEPDVLGGARLPKPGDRIVLFTLSTSDEPSRSVPAYQAALLTLQLASAVAATDGSFGQVEREHLEAQIQAWEHLDPSHRIRLKAYLDLLVAEPVSLASLKKRLEALSADARESLASFIVLLAHADGTVSPEEVKTVEKIYKVLGLDSKRVFGDLHAPSSRPAVETPRRDDDASTSEFKLDAARIAALQKDTAKASALLASIFATDVVEPSQEESDAIKLDLETDDAPAAQPTLLNLDEAHAAFAHLLLTQSQWTREELQDAAADLDLMLDGALERINEAAFDTYDMPITEGDNPIDVNDEVRERLKA